MKNRNLWRVVTLALALVMLFAVVACTADDTDPAATTAGNAATTTAKQTTAKKTTAATTAAKTTAATTAATTGGSSDPVNPTASVYSGAPDQSWFDIKNPKTEYVLTTADQFVGFAAIRQNITKTDFDFSGVTIKLACDVILNEGTSEEIKANKETAKTVTGLNSNYIFCGTFDGQGHTVSGYYLPSQTSFVKGMFGGLGTGCVIKDLVLENCYAAGPSRAEKHSGGFLAGTVRANAAAEGPALISNVKISGLFEEGTEACQRVSGFVGSTYEGASIQFENCEFSGQIGFPTSSNVGSFLGGLQDASTATFINCKSDAALIGSEGVGGIVGQVPEAATAIIRGCSYTGTITCAGEKKGEAVGDGVYTDGTIKVALGAEDITTTLPAAFANAVKVAGSTCETGSTANEVNANQFKLTTSPATPNAGSANGAQKLKKTESTKTATDGIWHYYIDPKGVLGSADEIAKCYITWTFELTEAGTYNIASYHRLKNDNRGGIITIDGEIVIDFSYTASDIATESRDYLASDKTVPVITDEYAGAYMNWGVAIELDAGAHTITYTDTDTNSVHWRDFYFAKVEPAPAA